MRPLTIDLHRIEQALLSQEAVDYYLDLHSGSVLLVAPGDPVPGADEKYDVQPDRYLIIQPLPQAIALAMREAFLFSLADPHAHTALRQALAGRKPLRSFDYQLDVMPQARQAWLAYQAEHSRELALQWLEDNGLEQAGAGPLSFPEERSPVRH